MEPPSDSDHTIHRTARIVAFDHDLRVEIASLALRGGMTVIESRDIEEAVRLYKEVMRVTGFRSRTTIWNRVRDQSFPAPLRIGRNIIRWPAGDLTDWMAALPHQNYRPIPDSPPRAATRQ